MDLEYYARTRDRSSRREMEQLRTDLVESLASVVEFDGLETTQDPSPRSSLTLAQFTENKGIFVKRMLMERTIPLTESIVRLFGSGTRAQCEAYIRQYYSNEIPQQRTKPLLADVVQEPSTMPEREDQ